MPLVTKNFADIITFTRASTGTYFDSAGVLQSAAVDQPRFDYNPATLAAQGLLIEEARTNLVLQSGWAGAVGGSPGTAPTSWTIGFGTGANTTLVNSIYGTAEQAVKFDADATERIMYQQTVNVTNGVQYAASVFVEAVSGVIGDAIAVTNGTGTATQNTFVTNPSTPGRYTILFTATATGTVNIRYGIGTTAGVAGTCSVTMSRPQVEAGAFPTSYIPTTVAQVTRNADQASVNTLSPWYNASAGTIYAEFQSTITSTSSAVNSFNDATSNNRVSLFANTSAFQAARNTGGAGVLFTPFTANAPSASINKAALAFANLDYALCGNGGTVATASTYNVPTVTQFQLGNQLLSSYLNGYLRRVTFYPRRLSNVELVTLTT